jgi:hypothetical protein
MVSVLSLFDQKINPLVIPAMKRQIFMMKLLLASALAGLLLLCATYFTLVYYRLVAIAKGIEPYGLIRSRNFFQPKAECSISARRQAAECSRDLAEVLRG